MKGKFSNGHTVTSVECNFSCQPHNHVCVCTLSLVPILHFTLFQKCSVIYWLQLAQAIILKFLLISFFNSQLTFFVQNYLWRHRSPWLSRWLISFLKATVWTILLISLIVIWHSAVLTNFGHKNKVLQKFV